MIRTLLFVTIVGSLVACGGGQTYETHGTDRAPGVDAEIRVQPLDSGNFRVNIDAENMPPPSRLASDATTYVVWVTSQSEGAQRLGYLPLGDSRDAEMYGTTVDPSFEVLVTAESQENPPSPSEHVVVRQRARMK